MLKINLLKCLWIAILLFLFNGLCFPQSTDTVLSLSKAQIVCANQTKIFADTCSVMLDRSQITIEKLISVVNLKENEIKSKDAEKIALYNELTQSDAMYQSCQNNAAELRKQLNKAERKRKFNGIMLGVVSGIAAGVAVLYLLK